MTLVTRSNNRISIQDMIQHRLNNYTLVDNSPNVDRLFNEQVDVTTICLKTGNKLKYSKFVRGITLKNIETLVIDIKGLTENNLKSYKNKLKIALDAHKEAKIIVLVYDDNSPMKSVSDIIRNTCPKLILNHFYSCNNSLGQDRAMEFICSKEVTISEPV